MEELKMVPPGQWVTVTEAQSLVPDVSRRRIQALAELGTVRAVKVLGRILLSRSELVTWRDGPRRDGRPKKGKPKGRPGK
jgi:hypothetical protein